MSGGLSIRPFHFQIKTYHLSYPSDTNYPRDNPSLLWIFLQFLVMPSSLHVPWSYPSTNILTWPIQIAPKALTTAGITSTFRIAPFELTLQSAGTATSITDSILLPHNRTIISGLLASIYYMVALYVEIPQHYKSYPSPTLLKFLHFLHLLTATPETAFLHAISSAAITYELTLKCRYNIVGCYCVTRRVSNSRSVRSGCGDNVEYGMEQTRLFFDELDTRNDARTAVNRHNNRVGREVRVVVVTRQSVAPYKRIRIPESMDILLMESGILGLWNPQYSSRNPESH